MHAKQREERFWDALGCREEDRERDRNERWRRNCHCRRHRVAVTVRC